MKTKTSTYGTLEGPNTLVADVHTYGCGDELLATFSLWDGESDEKIAGYSMLWFTKDEVEKFAASLVKAAKDLRTWNHSRQDNKEKTDG